MTTSREAAVVALVDLMTATGAFKFVSRRNRNSEGIGPEESPALFLMEMRDSYQTTAPSVTRVTMHIMAILYNDVGNDPNAAPTTALNDALDALTRAVLKVDPGSGRNTLGGLVHTLTIVGDTDRLHGAKEGKTMAVVPLEIVIP